MPVTLDLVWFIVIYALLPALGLVCVAIIVAGWLRDFWRWLFVVAILLMVCWPARADAAISYVNSWYEAGYIIDTSSGSQIQVGDGLVWAGNGAPVVTTGWTQQ